MEIYVQKNGQSHGPFPETKVREGIDTGEYAANDLAWTSGKASWQPLSVLICLDVTKPPPFDTHWQGKELDSESSEFRTDEPPKLAEPWSADSSDDSEQHRRRASVTGLMPGETVVFQDDPLYCRILITNLRVKINDGTYSLKDVSEAKCEISLTTREGYTGFAKAALWTVFWLYSIFVLVSILSGDFEWVELIGPPLFFHLARNASRTALEYYYNDVTVVLLTHWEPTVCYRKECYLRGSQLGGASERERRNAQQRFEEGMTEPTLIAQAINKAIALKVQPV